MCNFPASCSPHSQFTIHIHNSHGCLTVIVHMCTHFATLTNTQYIYKCNKQIHNTNTITNSQHQNQGLAVSLLSFSHILYSSSSYFQSSRASLSVRFPGVQNRKGLRTTYFQFTIPEYITEKKLIKPWNLIFGFDYIFKLQFFILLSSCCLSAIPSNC